MLPPTYRMSTNTQIITASAVVNQFLDNRNAFDRHFGDVSEGEHTALTAILPTWTDKRTTPYTWEEKGDGTVEMNIAPSVHKADKGILLTRQHNHERAWKVKARLLRKLEGKKKE
jgi:hypothetical protein